MSSSERMGGREVPGPEAFSASDGVPAGSSGVGMHPQKTTRRPDSSPQKAVTLGVVLRPRERTQTRQAAGEPVAGPGGAPTSGPPWSRPSEVGSVTVLNLCAAAAQGVSPGGKLSPAPTLTCGLAGAVPPRPGSSLWRHELLSTKEAQPREGLGLVLCAQHRDHEHHTL